MKNITCIARDMTEIVRFAGVLMILFSAILGGREYERFVRKRSAEEEGFIALLLHIRAKVECFLSVSGELVTDFENEALMSVGYLGGEAASASERFYRALPKLSISEEAKNILNSFFNSFGKEYKGGTLSLVDRTRESLERYVDSERDIREKNIKIFRTVLAALALGVVILLI